jgi:hypothetical protein
MSLTFLNTITRARSRIAAFMVGTLLSAAAFLAITASSASASVGQSPANCGNPTTWKEQSFNVAGDTVLLELRHSYPCEAGWAKCRTHDRGAAIAPSEAGMVSDLLGTDYTGRPAMLS